MDLIWSKDKLLKIFSKSTIRLAAAHASGDGGILNRCCRLCGNENSLRCFCTSYLCDGVEERYDRMLFDSFGVRVSPPDCMICENCVRQLRNINRFRSLVMTAFARAASEYSTRLSQKSGRESRGAKSKSKRKSTSEVLKNESRAYASKQAASKKSLNSNVQLKRTNVACSVCKQRYPMLLPIKSAKIFICSRCKKKSEPNNTIWKQCNAMKPACKLREHIETHTINNLRRKSRLSMSLKTFNSVKTPESRIAPVRHYYCPQCPKKYTVGQHLEMHIDREHRKESEYLCVVCGKDMKTREMLDRHLAMHTGQPIYQCDVCLRCFKGKRSFQLHYLTHGK